MSKQDLDNFNRGQNDFKKGMEDSEGRSIKSEYDYGSKRKFVDVLGNINKKNAITFEKLDQKKNDVTSMRSKYSNQSSHRKAMSMTAKNFGSQLPNIDEKDEIYLVNKDGMKVDLNDQQLNYLYQLAKESSQIEQAIREQL